MNMKIAAWSDGHEILPVIEDSNIMIIAGDIIPLGIQRKRDKSEKWLKTIFFEYVKNLNCDIVCMIPGNHDFIFEQLPRGAFKDMIRDAGLEYKLIYLEDELYEYEGLKIYGCPWCTGPLGWAFCPSRSVPDITSKYEAIPDCDILITHQPPKIDKVGCSDPYQAYERNFGSDRLKNVLDNKNIKYNFCGHIHTGVHGGIQYKDTMIYNVSLLDEAYESVYNVTYVTI